MLGAGGMGAVYQVHHLISDRVEAMKVLLPDLASRPDLAERFVREIRLQASLSHPHIASLHNALRLENQLLMVMEFIDGETLADIIRRVRLSPAQAVDIMCQTLDALDYAHYRGVIHRDVKPSNIMLTQRGVVKLMDFGIARGARELTMLTQAGAAIGSMYYMAPEQITGDAVDHRADIYSAAATLYELLTGQRPIRGGSAAEVMDAQLCQLPESPRVLNPSVSDELARATLKGLEKSPALRYQTAGEFRAELSRILTNMSNPGQTSSLVRPRMTREVAPLMQTPVQGSPLPRSTAAASQALNFDPIGLERVRKDLAQHIGPLAKVLVDRAAKKSRNWQELYSALAGEIPAGKERERFLASCPR